MERLETRGDDPGWINDHRARFEAPSSIHVSGGKLDTEQDYIDNAQSFVFDVRTCAWSRVAD